MSTRYPERARIGRYRRVLVEVHQADPATPEVARGLIALIATRWPGTPAEHVGSSAVPGLAGKGIIDLLLPTRRRRRARLPRRLRADRRLCRRYAALKRAIVASGPVDPVTFTTAKHDWIVATLARLGLAGHQPRRLYRDDPDLDNRDRLAS